MYLNTPSSASSTRTNAAQPPSTPTHAPRMGAHGLPPSPHTPASPMTPYSGAYAPFPMPHQTSGHTVAYGLMTPPASPDKPSGRKPDFHPMLDARSPSPYVFDVRQGVPLKAEVAHAPAMNHPVRAIRVNVGPMCFDVSSKGGSTVTVLDVLNGFATALNGAEASPQEVAAAVRMGFAHPSLPQRGVQRGRLIDLKPFFGGFTLRTIERGVAFVDCQMRAR